jgi:hypothetical protein
VTADVRARDEPSRHDYPDVRIREARSRYAYEPRIPCRVLTQTAKRIKIRVSKADGETAIRYVKPESIERDARVF